MSTAWKWAVLDLMVRVTVETTRTASRIFRYIIIIEFYLIRLFK